MKRCGELEMSWTFVKSWSPLQHPGLLKTITYDDGKQNPGHQQSNQILCHLLLLRKALQESRQGQHQAMYSVCQKISSQEDRIRLDLKDQIEHYLSTP